MPSQCTWKDPDFDRCTNHATYPQTANDGSVWANLCNYHHMLMDKEVGSDVKKMLSYWVRAQGGAKAATARMMPERKATAEIAKRFRR